MGTIHHLQGSIEGLLKRSDSELSDLFDKPGHEIRSELEGLLNQGHIYIGSSGCEGFDPIMGCPGHKSE